MIQATASQGFEADIQTVNRNGLAPLDAIGGKHAVTTATGYVFHIADPDVKGTFEFEGRRYAFLDIEDYVVWTDEEAVRRKYEEVVGKARGAS